MKSLADLHVAIGRYSSKYRREDFPPLVASGLYDLFSERGGKHETTLSWPAPYQSATSAGVYIALDEDLNVLYVGKASLGNSIGFRLQSYFRYAQDRRCEILSPHWTSLPRYVVTIGVAYPFEAPALEEYLIGELQPPDNKKGIRPPDAVPPNCGE